MGAAFRHLSTFIVFFVTINSLAVVSTCVYMHAHDCISYLFLLGNSIRTVWPSYRGRHCTTCRRSCTCESVTSYDVPRYIVIACTVLHCYFYFYFMTSNVIHNVVVAFCIIDIQSSFRVLLDLVMLLVVARRHVLFTCLQSIISTC